MIKCVKLWVTGEENVGEGLQWIVDVMSKLDNLSLSFEVCRYIDGYIEYETVFEMGVN